MIWFLQACVLDPVIRNRYFSVKDKKNTHDHMAANLVCQSEGNVLQPNKTNTARTQIRIHALLPQ